VNGLAGLSIGARAAAVPCAVVPVLPMLPVLHRVALFRDLRDAEAGGTSGYKMVPVYIGCDCGELETGKMRYAPCLGDGHLLDHRFLTTATFAVPHATRPCSLRTRRAST
jgi:hypothetical protein